MVKFLLDTNVVSELRKKRANDDVLAWVASRNSYDLYLSAITILELELGVRRMESRDPQQGAHLRRWLDDKVIPAFTGRIIAVDYEVARRAAALHVPNPRPERDCLIAATALVQRMTVATRNTSDFRPMSVQVTDPWHAR